MSMYIRYASLNEVSVLVPSSSTNLQIKKQLKLLDDTEKSLSVNGAMTEAVRCLNCKTAPCVTACPIKVNIPEFISALKERNLTSAAVILQRDNPFPAVCGRICAKEMQCESECTLNRRGRPLAIGALERCVADWMLENVEENVITNGYVSSKKNIAVVGSGIEGLTAAASLARWGHDVKIYELMNETGNDLLSEIPEFRLPKKVLIGEIARILSLGVRVECNAPLGQKISIRHLYTEYDAILIAHRSGTPVSPGIPGEHLGGVYSAQDYLVHVNPLIEEGGTFSQLKNLFARRVVVIGGGNTATDCARVAIRLGAKKVKIVYHRRESDMPASQKEVEKAKDEGVEVLELLSPIKIMGNERGCVKGVVCQAMRPDERDYGGRSKPVPIDDELWEIETDLIVYAFGTSPSLMNFSKLAKNGPFGRESLIINKDGSTNCPGFFVIDDNIRKQSTAVQAIASGKKAALVIHTFLNAEGKG